MDLKNYNLGGITLDNIVILANILVTIILFVLLVVTMTKLSKMKKNYNVFLSGKDAKSLEDVLIKKLNLLSLLDESVKDIYAHIEQIDKNLLLTYQKIGLVKYDAFKEKGGQMSFVLVLLTKENNGILMNCMHSNSDGCYTYVKRIEHGTSKVTLSTEEDIALRQALGEKFDKPQVIEG